MANHSSKGAVVYRNTGLTDITTRYRMPIAARVSILHRVSGALLFLALPFLLNLFGRSLDSEPAFDGFRQTLATLPVKVVVLGLSWAYLHHFCAGLRFLWMDVDHNATAKVNSRRSAIAVFAASLGLTAIVVIKLFGATA
ncbi:succinate dehydrogenase, cytochrome b556 subunit [Ralstonia sp. SET104]|uniref:succinate dehydrogenase, cytochrome b556 subunit n=1 Tax=Ralstonia sp. SET104 TaxID=2448774 RepID=UPI000FF944BD|nr:succinate dehydrogenase, cytochrome b556 subunit [Ralstonia sp. SET104]GCB04445.1 succinate dehydrogenase cytochrome b-556 subunit [Ralstonia sp. SET104]